MTADRIALAEAFLSEAVYRSRGDQAGATLLSAARSGQDGPSCGLGEKPRVVLDLTPKAEELFERLFDGSAVDIEAVRARMAAWVKRQDALDRKRNHFLKDFRGAHGMDRRSYSPELLAEFESGLDAVNAQVAAERGRAASELLEIASAPG